MFWIPVGDVAQIGSLCLIQEEEEGNSLCNQSVSLSLATLMDVALLQHVFPATEDWNCVPKETFPHLSRLAKHFIAAMKCLTHKIGTKEVRAIAVMKPNQVIQKPQELVQHMEGQALDHVKMQAREFLEG